MLEASSAVFPVRQQGTLLEVGYLGLRPMHALMGCYTTDSGLSVFAFILKS